MKSLSGLDAVFLYAETPSTPMNVIATLVVEGRVDFEAIVERVRARLPDLPPFRRRLVEVPLAHPAWVEVGDIDLRRHVERVRAPHPGDGRALGVVVGRVARRRLDRSRPLWQLFVVEGLEEERSALVVQAHHAVLDGVTGAALLLHLFDRPEGGEVIAPGGETSLSTVARLTHGIARLRERPGVSWRTLRQAGRSAAQVTRARLADIAVRDAALPFQAPPAPFNGPVSARRSVGYARTALDGAKSARAAFGGTVNDIVLAACSGALRAALIERNALTERPLVAAVPVSTRSFDDPADCGNRISAFLTELPVQLEDPLHRLSEVSRATRRAKQLHAAFVPQTLASLAELAPPALSRIGARLYSAWKLAALHPPVCNLVISNVPGPPQSLQLFGHRVRALCPHGPLMEGAGLNVTVMSYSGAIDVGVLACGERVPDAPRLAARVAESLEELVELAEASLSEVSPATRKVA